jgi:hypothetical protein
MGNCTNCVERQQQQQQTQQRTSLTSSSSFDNLTRSYHRNFLPNRFRTFQPYNLNTLIDETLSILRTVVDTDQDPPHAMLVVSRIANREDRWLDVMIALIERIPINDPLGATVIALLLDECSLPSRELLQQLIKRICIDNRSRIKLLQTIIEEYIKENSKQLQKRTINSPIETHINEEEEDVDVNEIIPVVANQSHEIAVKQQQQEK